MVHVLPHLDGMLHPKAGSNVRVGGRVPDRRPAPVIQAALCSRLSYRNRNGPSGLIEREAAVLDFAWRQSKRPLALLDIPGLPAVDRVRARSEVVERVWCVVIGARRREAALGTRGRRSHLDRAEVRNVDCRSPVYIYRPICGVLPNQVYLPCAALGTVDGIDPEVVSCEVRVVLLPTRGSNIEVELVAEVPDRREFHPINDLVTGYRFVPDNVLPYRDIFGVHGWRRGAPDLRNDSQHRLLHVGRGDFVVMAAGGRCQVIHDRVVCAPKSYREYLPSFGRDILELRLISA